MAEDLIELVEVAFIFHEAGARQVIEILHPLVGEVDLQGFHQHQVLFQGDGHLGGLELVKERREHGAPLASPIADLARDYETFGSAVAWVDEAAPAGAVHKTA